MKTNPILVRSFRGEVLESFHRGVVCVVNQMGEIIYSEGDSQQLCYPRSALKFFQQIPLLSKNAQEEFNLTLEEIAILVGSHNGEEKHVETVLNILNKGGFTENDLECGPQMPSLKKDAIAMYQKGEKARKIHNNCSGKHAGFLLLCKLLKLNHKNYINPEHPVQKIIAETCARYHEYPLDKMQTGIDGCSAPIFAFPVYNQALAYKNLVWAKHFPENEQAACKLISEAVTSYPFMVAGSSRYCTELMETTGKKIIGKTGADGVYCLAIPEHKLGICIKIDDGKMGPQYLVAQNLLYKSGLLTDEENSKLSHYAVQEQKNFGKSTTGILDVNPEISLTIPLS